MRKVLSRVGYGLFVTTFVVVGSELMLRAVALGGLLRPATGVEAEWTRPFVTAPESATAPRDDHADPDPAPLALPVLSASQIRAIQRALKDVGEFGEVRLIVTKGRLRFIGTFKTEALTLDD